MNSFQGMICKSVNNASVQFDTIAYMTGNVANYNTTAYKGVRFDSYLKNGGWLHGAERTDHSQGSFFLTKRPLDIAINGQGFIPVTKANGETLYTRNGSFRVNKEGYLVTADNSIVGSGIQIPHNYHRLKISPDGVVSVIPEVNQKEQVLGEIPIVNFNNPEGLKLVDGNKYEVSEDSGEPKLIKDHTMIKQGGVERSNVDMYEMINDMLKANASFIASTNMIKMADDMYRQAINLRQ